MEGRRWVQKVQPWGNKIKMLCALMWQSLISVSAHAGLSNLITSLRPFTPFTPAHHTSVSGLLTLVRAS